MDFGAFVEVPEGVQGLIPKNELGYTHTSSPRTAVRVGETVLAIVLSIDEQGGRMACFDLATGRRLWERKLKYRSRPLLNDRTFYAEGCAWDLVSGADRPFAFKRSYGCGILSAFGAERPWQHDGGS